jgi:hypothetical protein
MKRTIAAIEITSHGIERIVLVARDPLEMADTYRMLARATRALADLDRSIKEQK